MAPKTKSRAHQQLPKKRTPAPFTVERLVPLFEDMKDMMRSTTKASETVLRQEMQEMKMELRQEMQSMQIGLRQEIETVRSELTKEIRALGDKIDITQYAVSEHTKHIVSLQASVANHETRIAHLE